MNKMFNKSVIAVALLGTFAVSAGEVDFSAAPLVFDVTVANQGNDGVAAGTTEGAILVAKELLDNAADVTNKTLTRTLIPAEYTTRFVNYKSPVDLKEKSTIVFKFEGGAITAAPTLALFRRGAGADTNLNTADDILVKVGSLTDFVTDADGNYTSAKFQLDAGIAGNQVTANDILVLGVAADAAALISAGPTRPTIVIADGSSAVSVSVPEVRDDNAQLLNAPLAAAESLVVVASQYKTTVTANTDKIDVNLLRKGFTAATAGDDANSATSFGVLDVDLAVANFALAGNVVFPTTAEYALKITGTQAAISKIEEGATALKYTATSNTWALDGTLGTFADLVADVTVKATVKSGTSAVAIEEAVYPGTVTVSAAAAGANRGATKAFPLFSDATIFDWKLNAATATIPYMPIGTKGTPSDTQQVIYVTNKGASVGNIFVDVWLEDGTKKLTAQKVGVTVKNGITKIGSEIKALLDAADVANQKVTIKVVAEIPQKEFEVFSAFTVNGNRQLVINDSNVTSSRNVGL